MVEQNDVVTHNACQKKLFKATNAKCNECHLEPKWFRGE